MQQKISVAATSEVPEAPSYEQTMILLYYAFLLKGLPQQLRHLVADAPEVSTLTKLSHDLPRSKIAEVISRSSDALGDRYVNACAKQESLVSYYHKGADADPVIVWVDGLTSPGTWPLWTLFNVKRQVDACFNDDLRPGRYNVDAGLIVLKYPFHQEGLGINILGASTAEQRLQKAASAIEDCFQDESGNPGTLNQRPLILIGHSAGAQLVLELAQKFKNQVKLVIPINVPYTFRNGVVHLALAVGGTAIKLVPGAQKFLNRYSRIFGASEYLDTESFNIVPDSHWRTRVYKDISLGLFASITVVRLALLKTLRSFHAPVYFINSDRDELFTFFNLEKALKKRFPNSTKFEFKELISPHTPTTHYKESEAVSTILAQKIVSSIEQLHEPESILLGRFIRFIARTSRLIARTFGGFERSANRVRTFFNQSPPD